ncbi:MAG: hypothetical protein HY330_03645 [Chloroflexi bacterium]|nr:hypothetical protein [Chloroflexota bacterium]
MTEQPPQDDLSNAYPYLLVAAWPQAWHKYKGYLANIGALPGLLLALGAGILQIEDRSITAGKYWNSRLRSDLNLALWKAEAEGWLRQVDTTSVRKRAGKIYDVCSDAAFLFDTYGHNEVESVVIENQASPDLRWWIATIAGHRALQELQAHIEAAKKAAAKRRLGF